MSEVFTNCAHFNKKSWTERWKVSRRTVERLIQEWMAVNNIEAEKANGVMACRCLDMGLIDLTMDFVNAYECYMHYVLGVMKNGK